MSQQSDANRQVLRLFRFWLAIGIMVLLMWSLVAHFQQQRLDAQTAIMAPLASKFAEQAALLHGEWLQSNRPARFYFAGWAVDHDRLSSQPGASFQVVMSSQGWPKDIADGLTTGSACERLWRALLSTPPEVDGDPLQVSALIAAPGCAYRLQQGGFTYQFADGAVSVIGN
jgi:hypothetical protein